MTQIPKEVLISDYILFGQYYFPNIFYKPSPEFHYSVGDIIIDLLKKPGKKIGIVAPRGFSKTTIITTLASLYTACVFSKFKKIIVVISETDKMAQAFIGSIKNELDNNERLIKDWGINGYLLKKGGICSAHELELANGVRIIGLGAGNQLRGLNRHSQRPDLILCDDILGQSDMTSENSRINKLQWFQNVILPLGKDSGKTCNIIVLNTRVHEDDLIGRLQKIPTFNIKEYSAIEKFSSSILWFEWKEILTNMQDTERLDNAMNFFLKHEKEMLENTKVLWEDLNSYYDLMLKKVEMGDTAFQTEYQNVSSNLQHKVFNKKSFRYDNHPLEEIEEIIICHDPSLNKKNIKTKRNDGDYSPIITLGRCASGYMYVLDVQVDRLAPHQMQMKVLEKIKEYNADYCIIEANAFQQFYETDIKRLAIEHGITTCIFNPVINTSNKNLRVLSLEPLFINGYLRFLTYKLNEPGYALLISQLDGFNSKINDNKDDCPDCLEMGIRKWRKDLNLNAQIARYRKF